MTPKKNILEVKDLRSGYGRVEILRGVNLTVGVGELVALLGSNGAGKTTFNHTICALVRLWSGEVVFDGENFSFASSRRVVQAGLIQVPEGRKIFPNLSITENLELGSFARARERRAANLERMFDLFPRLRERRAQLAGTLSGGEQQMLAISRGLMAEPKLLILDEPSLGLSPLLVDEMFQLIKRIRQENIAVLLVEQNVAQALEIADKVYVMENGAISFQGTAQDLLATDALRQAYLGL